MTTPIYTLSAHFRDDRGGRHHPSRTFGYYHDLEDARIAARENHGSMQECLYTHLVIEEVKEGVHGHSLVIDWYEWAGANKSEVAGWKACAAPDWSRGLCGFSIG